MRRVVVIGAGPTGLAAALGALRRGADVTVLERGEVGESLRSWGPTRFFSPLRMNVSQEMREVLGGALPDDDALLTGPELADILGSLANRDPLLGRVRTHTTVVAVGRRGLTRSDYAGHPLRAERAFRLIVEHSCEDTTTESMMEAEVVLDATGGYAIPNFIGAGGLPVHGERALDGRAIRSLGVLASRRDDLGGKRVLLVGHGHSAANALAMLADSGTQVTWAVRTPNRRPCVDVANDPLPERQRVVQFANALAETPPAWLTVERRAMVESVVGDVMLTGNRRVACDAIAAFTGSHPDARHIGELAVETSPVTEGGARFYRTVSNITDCLTVPRLRPEDLASGEPNFWFVGSRIYGRAPTFLLQTGYQQLETILDTL